MALVLAYRDVPSIYDSPVMIVMAETLRSLPYAILLLWPFLRSFPQDYLDAAALDGHGPWGQMFHVVCSRCRCARSSRPGRSPSRSASASCPRPTSPRHPDVAPISVLIWGLLHTGVESHLAGVALIMLLVVAAAGLFAMAAVRSLRALERP